MKEVELLDMKYELEQTRYALAHAIDAIKRLNRALRTVNRYREDNFLGELLGEGELYQDKSIEFLLKKRGESKQDG